MRQAIAGPAEERVVKSRRPNGARSLGWGTILLVAATVVPAAALAQNVPYPNCRSYQLPHLKDVQHYTAWASCQCEDASGWYNWCWEIEITQPRDITITIDDREGCPGHYTEVWINNQLIGTTPEVTGLWGGWPPNPCHYPQVGGTFSARLGCSGVFVLRFRDKGVDGHSYQEIRDHGMCPPPIRFTYDLIPPMGPSPNAWEKDVVLALEHPVVEANGEGARLAMSSSDDFATVAAGFQAAADSAESCPRTVIELLDQVEPFITVDPVSKVAQLDRAGAAASGVSPQAIDLAYRWIDLQNRIIREGMLNVATVEFFEELARRFPGMAPPGPRRQCGYYGNPTECEPYVQSGYFGATHQDVVDELVRRGFHLSRHPVLNGPENDYTKVKDYTGCPYPGAFRIHARIIQCGYCWTFMTQGEGAQKPEPNPELTEYTWPYKLWPLYNAWWHLQYCNKAAAPCP